MSNTSLYDGPMVQPMNVLVADDEPTNVEVIATILASIGHAVATSTDGQEALSLCQEWAKAGEPFDLVVLDVYMPVMNGLDVVKRLREDELTSSVPILCCSARAGRPDVERGLSVGCDHYLTKPFRRSDFIAAIELTLQAAENRG